MTEHKPINPNFEISFDETRDGISAFSDRLILRMQPLAVIFNGTLDNANRNHTLIEGLVVAAHKGQLFLADENRETSHQVQPWEI